MQNWVKYTIGILLVVLLVVGIVACIHFIDTGTQTAREAAMLSIILTLLSVLASWLVTHLYSEAQYEAAIRGVETVYRNNLRTYAVKASEKVDNLSKELVRLSNFLVEEEDNPRHENATY